MTLAYLLVLRQLKLVIKWVKSGTDRRDKRGGRGGGK
jgi:hypothetical protein